MGVMQICPLKFKPIFKERIWGGQKMREVFGKDLPAGKRIGESWELADLAEDRSEITNGSLAGETITSAIEQLGQAITGKENYQPPFPLLIKILDAQDVLSVQVHPDPETCKRTGKGDPKTECWYIIDAAKDAVICKGLKPGVTRKQFADSIVAGTCADLLNKISVKAGQCHFLPAGTCHAIGAGLLIAEIQTPSDTTYRVFDWNRLDKNGTSRPLHIEDALESINFEITPGELSVTTTGRLVDSDVFKIDKTSLSANEKIQLTAGQMKVVMIIEGAGQIFNAQIEPVVFIKGDTLLIPAAFEGAMLFSGKSTILTSTVNQRTH